MSKSNISDLSKVIVTTLVQLLDECNREPKVFSNVVRRIMTQFGCLCEDNSITIETIRSLVFSAYDLISVVEEEESSKPQGTDLFLAMEKLKAAIISIDNLILKRK